MNKFKNLKIKLQDVYLSKKDFEKDLEGCLTIIKYPTKKRLYYECEHISADLLKRQVNVYVKN